ncbi:MAG: hypothetical protein K8R48_08290 [Alphaproteobacteria bacterium]|nr:hypothetical protein [Alphaproteobacteria bacterium]
MVPHTLRVGLMVFLLFLAGCADYAPVPGGTDAVNPSYYSTKEDFLSRLSGIDPGMPEKEVLAKMGRREEELNLLRRNEIMTALLGSSIVTFDDDATRENILHDLYGYKLNYKIVKRRHGFSSLIRIRTDEKGFDYTVTLIFYQGMLFEKPLVTGGIVNGSSSKTFFDFLSPGIAVDRITK